MESTQQPQKAAGEATSAPILETYRYSAASMPTTEDQLFELVRLSDIPMSKQLFDVIVELLRLNIPPSAIFHVLKTLRAQATHTTMPPSLQTSRASSRAHTPPPVTSTHTSLAKGQGEANKPSHRKSEHSHAASRHSGSQQSAETEKTSRKHRHGSSTKPKSSEKARSSTKAGSGGSSKTRGHAQDSK